MNARRVIWIVCAVLVVAICIALAAYVSSLLHERRVAGVTSGYSECISLKTGDKTIGTCLRTLAKEAMSRGSVADVEEAFQAVPSKGDLNWCHEFMHYAGWELYDKTENFSDAFVAASGMCDSGMMHGVVEQYVSRSAQGYDAQHFAEKVAPATCVSGLGKYEDVPGARGTCFHGLGHAFMFLTNNELNSSLQFCDYLGAGAGRACYSGVFMEGMQQKQVGRNGERSNVFAVSDDPEAPCGTLDPKYKNSCYAYRGVEFFIKSKGDIASAFKQCGTIDPRYRNDCLEGIGEDIPSPSKPTAKAAQDCAAALTVDRVAYEMCIDGGLKFVVQMARGKADEAVVYCDSVEDAFKNTCYSNAGRYLSGWTTKDSDLTSLCGAFGAIEARRLCMQWRNDR